MAATPGAGDAGGEHRQETPMETDGLDVTTPQRSNDDLPGREGLFYLFGWGGGLWVGSGMKLQWKLIGWTPLLRRGLMTTCQVMKFN